VELETGRSKIPRDWHPSVVEFFACSVLCTLYLCLCTLGVDCEEETWSIVWRLDSLGDEESMRCPIHGAMQYLQPPMNISPASPSWCVQTARELHSRSVAQRFWGLYTQNGEH
jgi:hypothetical protein